MKVTLCVVDHDDIGPVEIRRVIENQRYPNRCISPNVMEVESRDIGEWHDEHPLNYSEKAWDLFK